MKTMMKLTNVLCLGEGHFFFFFLKDDNAVGERRGEGEDRF